MAEPEPGGAVTLAPLHGHAATRAALARAARERSLPATLLIHGAPGVGKQRLALWLGQLLLCESPSLDGPCGACRPCHLALRLEHPDLHWFFPLPRPRKAATPDRMAAALEDARAEALQEARESPLRPSYSVEPRGLYLAVARTLRKQAQKRPSMGNRQVFIVAEAEQLVPQEASPEAANALLKVLEEPPGDTLFVLTSNEPGRLLSTIRSRSLPIHLPALPVGDVARFLEDAAGADEDEARRAAELSQGSIGRALGFLGDGDDMGPLERIRQDAFGLLQTALSGRAGEAFAAALGYAPSGARGLLELFTALEEWLRDLAAAAAAAEGEVVNRDARDFLVRRSREEGIHPLGAVRAASAVAWAKELASGNVNPQLLVACLLREMSAALRDHPGPVRRP